MYTMRVSSFLGGLPSCERVNSLHGELCGLTEFGMHLWQVARVASSIVLLVHEVSLYGPLCITLHGMLCWLASGSGSANRLGVGPCSPLAFHEQVGGTRMRNRITECVWVPV